MARKRKGAVVPLREPTSEEQAAATCHEWFTTVDKPAKDFYVDEMTEIDKLYRNEHWDLLAANGKPLRSSAVKAKRPNATENITFALIDGEICEFARNVDLVDFPIDPDDEEAATAYTDIKQFIADKNNMESERIEALTDFFWQGTMAIETPWDPTWTGGRGPNRWIGDIRWRHVPIRAVFPDARCGEDINLGQRIHKVSYVTPEYIKSRYGVDVEPDYGTSEDIETSDPTVASAANTDLAGRVFLVETWYKGDPLVKDTGDPDGDGLHIIWWCGQANPIHLAHANYNYYDSGESEIEFPIHFAVRHKRAGSCWGYGDAIYLKSVQIVHNKTVELLIEGNMHAALGKTFFEPGAIDEPQQKQIQRDGALPGAYLPVNDVSRIKPVFPQGLPGSVVEEASRLPRAMEQIIGRPDVVQGRNPGSVVAFAALNLLANRARVRSEKADVVITNLWRRCGKYINRLIQRNYAEARVYRLIGKDVAIDKLVLKKRGVFERDSYRKVYDFNANNVVPLKGKVIQNPDTGEMQQIPDYSPPDGYEVGKDYEVYDPELDVRCATSQQMPSDRMYYIDMAAKLLQTQSIDLPTFYAVVEKGRFPTWKEMEARAAEIEQGRAQAAQPQPQQPPLSVSPNGEINFSLSSKDPNVVWATLAQVMQQGPAQSQQPITPEQRAKIAAVVQQLNPQDAQDLLGRIQGLNPEDQDQLVQQIAG